MSRGVRQFGQPCRFLVGLFLTLACGFVLTDAATFTAKLSLADGSFTISDGTNTNTGVNLQYSNYSPGSPNSDVTKVSLTLQSPFPSIFWYSPVVNVSSTAVPWANTTLYSNFTQVSTYLWRANDNLNPSQYSYMGSSGIEAFLCDSTPALFPGSFNCNFLNTSFAPIKFGVFFDNGTTDGTASVSFPNGLSLSTQNAILTILVSQLDHLDYGVYLMNDIIYSNNTARRSVAWKLVGGETFCAVMAMGNHMMVLAFLLAWVFPVFSTFLSSKSSRIPEHSGTDTFVWFAILFILLLVCCLPGGLPAWAILGLIWCFFQIILVTYYAVVRHQAKKNGEYDIELSQKAAAAQYSKGGSSIDEWNSRPHPMGSRQVQGLICNAVFILIWIIIMIIIAAAWGTGQFYVLNRMTSLPEVEYQPASVSKSTLALYSVRGAATAVKVNFFLQAFTTDYCGPFNNQNLTDSQKAVYIYYDYIYLYGIDMSIFERPNYTQYYSVNDWFSRKLAPGARPIAAPNDNSIIVSGADSRVLVFEKVPIDFELTVKQEDFTISTMLQNATLSELVNDGPMIVFRLAPQDYHRFHSPVTGNITYISNVIEGTIFSVNADAVNSDNNVFVYNKRQIIVIDSTNSGRVVLVVVGATCVGSIRLSRSLGDAITKGEELGYFQFGGSTVVALFQPNSLKFDSDLVFTSSFNVEQLINMGTRIGQGLM